MFSAFPAFLLFSITLAISACLSLSSANWILAWVGLEINLLSFIPMIVMTKGGQSAEAAAKYFIAQITGSTMFLAAPIMANFNIFPSLAGSAMLMGLMVKVGSAPTHQWFPSVMAGVTWSIGFVMMTWQKLAPMWLAAVVINVQELNYIMAVATLNGIFGSWGGLNQTQLRPLMGYSSIVHLGWMISLIPLSDSGVLIYLIVYSIILVPVVYSLNEGNKTSVKIMAFMASLSMKMSLFFNMSLLSLAGMPPFAGFFLKVFVLKFLVETKFFWVGIALVMASTISLAFYLHILILTFIVGITTTFSTRNVRSSHTTSFLFIITLLAMPLLMSLFLL